MPRKSHPKKEVEAALGYAESKGWRIEVGGGHAWGKMYCHTTSSCAAVVSSASPVSGVHLRILRITQNSFGGLWTTVLARCRNRRMKYERV
jgi:hypothetical protein